MKCPECGKEIANDSQFCEYCGAQLVKPKKRLKEFWITLIVLFLIAIFGGALYYQYERTTAALERADRKAEEARIAQENETKKRKEAEDKAREAEKKAVAEEKARKEAEENQRKTKAENIKKESELAYQKTLSSWQTTSDGVVILNDNNYGKFEQLSEQYPIIIDFYGDWCNPCRRMNPHIQKIVQKYKGKIIVGRYNVVNFKEEKAVANYVTSIPCLIFIKNHRKYLQFSGYKEEDVLLDYVDNFLSEK